MALVAEEIVEEWLRRDGFFTIRGLKAGAGEMDLLAIAMGTTGPVCRHIEVSSSFRPANYISELAKDERKASGRGASSAGRRTEEVMRAGVAEWVHKKFRDPKKIELRRKLCDVPWSEEFVVNVVKYDAEELPAIRAAGIRVHRLGEIVTALVRSKQSVLRAGGSDMVDLLTLCGEADA